MRLRIRGEKLTQISLCETDTITSIVQCITTLITTKQGTIPMYRQFGLPMNYIDKPLQIAKTIAISEITTAIQDFEPRVIPLGVVFDENLQGQLIPIAEVETIE